jgi:FixJ family two-component response regulator
LAPGSASSKPIWPFRRKVNTVHVSAVRALTLLYTFGHRLVMETRGTIAAPRQTLATRNMDETEKLKVFIVDDDPSVRQAIEWLLSSVNLFCESFGSASEFLERAAFGLAGCVVLDIRMPGLSGLDVQQALAVAGHEVPVIFVSAHADVALTVRAMKAGALEVLTKPFDDQALLDAVNQGLEKYRVRQRERQEGQAYVDRYATLTNREREVMGLVTKGLLNKQIAAELGIAEKTIKVHRAQVMHKMHAGSVAELTHISERLQGLRPKTNQTSA